MARFRLSTAAQADLEGIRAHTVDTWGEAQWFAYFRDLTLVFERISDEPGLGRRREAFRAGMRSIPCRSHVVFYLALGDGVIGVARILHAKQNAAALRWDDLGEG